MSSQSLAWLISLSLCLVPTSHEYRSVSKDHCLRITCDVDEPSGSAKYEMLSHDRQVWTQTFPFAISMAVVSNQGSVAGVSYSHGLSGHLKKDEPKSYGDCRLVIIDNKGKLLLNHSNPRTFSRQTHDPPKPESTGILLNEDSGVVTFRLVDDLSNESWLSYELSSGKALPTLLPENVFDDRRELKRLVDARIIPDTPLVLVQWWWFSHSEADGSKQLAGARFAVLDLSGKVVWRLDLPNDYVDGTTYRVDNAMIRRLQTGAAILDTSKKREFELWHVRDHQRVRYAIGKSDSSDGDWIVTERSRASDDDVREEQ